MRNVIYSLSGMHVNLCAMVKLTNMDRARAIGFLEAGWVQTDVAIHFGVSRLTISRLQARLRATGDVADRPRSGRPRVTTRRQDRYIEVQATRSRFVSAHQIQLNIQAAAGPGNQRISTQTIRNRLHRAGLRARRPARRPLLTDVHKAARLQWARGHRHWTRAQWRRVLFTDESRFGLHNVDGRLRVWRRTGERFAQNCVQPVVQYRGGSVMVWGGISETGKTDLVHIQGNLNGQRYRDEVVQPHVLPYAQRIGQGFVLQDDNARPHRARVVNDFLQQNGIQRMEWPACSPDLNPIELLWEQVGRALTARMVPGTTLAQLPAILTDAWTSITQASVARLINSMRRRCIACINAHGGHTRY